MGSDLFRRWFFFQIVGWWDPCFGKVAVAPRGKFKEHRPQVSAAVGWFIDMARRFARLNALEKVSVDKPTKTVAEDVRRDALR